MLNHKIYKHESSTEWVCFVHGAGGSSNIWFRQIKDFSQHFNVLLLDLRGHGLSKKKINKKNLEKYTFEAIATDVIELVDHLKLTQLHFIGISLGTIITRQIAEMRPDLVKSQIMGGAILKLNFRSQVLMWTGVIFKSIIPYMWLYKLFAFIIMPRDNHKESRSLFVREAKKLYQKEFIKWFRLALSINPLLKFIRAKDISIPTLYIMGEEDYMFLPSVESIVKIHSSSSLVVLPNTGHVVNVEQPEEFNKITIQYINKLVA